MSEVDVSINTRVSWFALRLVEQMILQEVTTNTTKKIRKQFKPLRHQPYIHVAKGGSATKTPHRVGRFKIM